MKNLSLRTKFTFVGLVALVSVVFLAYSGFSAVNKLLDLSRLEIVNGAVRAQMELDMMHDAINSDVAQAIQAVQTKDTKVLESSQASLKEHIATAEGAISKLQALELSPDVKDAFENTLPTVRAYEKSATDFMETAHVNIGSEKDDVRAASEGFNKEFVKLEADLGHVGDMVIDWSKQIKEEGFATAEREKMKLLLVMVVSIAIALFLPIYSRLSLFRSMNMLVTTASTLAQEEYDIEVPYKNRADEIGALAKALDALREKAASAYVLKKMLDDMPINIITADPQNDFKMNYVNESSKRTLRSLAKYMPVSSDNMLGQSIDIFHKDPQRIRRLLSDPSNLPHQAKIQVGPETLDLRVYAMYNKKGDYIGPVLSWMVVTQNMRLASEFESSVGAMATQLGATASGLQESATSLHGAIEELAVSAHEISRRVHDSLSAVHAAVEVGNQAGEMTHRLSDSADKISSVVTLIRSIAEKTNLLALNATIESARAGDAGKGFAVVANEVKTLANQSATAINEINKQISEMQNVSRSTAEAFVRISETIKNISTISATISATVEEQQAATAEIARNISGNDHSQQAIKALTIMSMSTQLADVSSKLSSECDAFLQKVRAI